jgi:hypothetical protein
MTNSIHRVNIDQAALRRVVRDTELVDDVDDFCAPPSGPFEEDDALARVPCSAGHSSCYVSPYGDSRYPAESIDRSRVAALEALTASEQAELTASNTDEMRADRWFQHKAVAFIREDPARFVVNGFRKAVAVFSWLPSPRRTLWPTVAYALSYGPIMTLGLLGMTLSWRSWREHSLIYGLFLTFIMVTAVFFGHTSHRAFLHVYWMAYAAGTLTGSVAGAQGSRSATLMDASGRASGAMRSGAR